MESEKLSTRLSKPFAKIWVAEYLNQPDASPVGDGVEAIDGN